MLINFSLLVENLANAFGNREAVVNYERDRRHTYAEYHLLTNRIANAIANKLKISREDHYVCILENDSLSLMSLVTAFKASGIMCYCNSRDSIEEHMRQIDFVSPKAVFMEVSHLASHYEALSERGIQVVVMDAPTGDWTSKPDVITFDDLIDGVSDANPDLVFDDRDDVKLVRFTGGTTGMGKCAKYSIDNWMMCKDSYYAIPDIAWGEKTRTIHIAPLSHGSAMITLPTWFAGGCNVTINDPDLEAYCACIRKESVTSAFIVPTLLYRLLEMDNATDGSLDSLENVFYGAAPMSPSRLGDLQKSFGNIFCQVYGATENICISAVLTKEDHKEIGGSLGHLASAGMPVPGVELMIADDNMKQVEQGEIGEICLRSRATCLGYHNNPEGTAAEFEQGYWKSGDLGKMDKNGFVYLVDRKKDLIISGGFNIYATEVESALMANDGVQLSAVVGIPHKDWGEQLHAEVILRDGNDTSEADLKAFVRERLGPIKTPKSIAFVSELPQSAVGKVLRRHVREKYWKDSTRQVN